MGFEFDLANERVTLRAMSPEHLQIHSEERAHFSVLEGRHFQMSFAIIWQKEEG